MIRLRTDFNALSVDERAWILHHGDAPLEECIAELGLQIGDRVQLFQEEDDFDVEGVLGSGYPGFPAPETPAWFVQVEWSTLRRF